MDLKEIRLKKYKKAVEVARLLGVSRGRYCHIETGRSKPTIEQAKKLGKLLEFEWWRLFENEEDKYHRECAIYDKRKGYICPHCESGRKEGSDGIQIEKITDVQHRRKRVSNAGGSGRMDRVQYKSP